MEELIRSVPAVTRAYMFICGLFTLGMSMKVISYPQLFLYMPFVTESGEWWRLLTNFFVFSTRFTMHWFIKMFMIFQYSSSLERGSFLGKRSDYVFFLLLGMVQLLAIHSLLSYLADVIPKYFAAPLLLASSLESFVVYVWSMRNKNARIVLFFVLPISASYLPLAHIGLDFLFDANLTSPIIGFIAGHVYYYFADVFPKLNNDLTIIKTPSFL